MRHSGGACPGEMFFAVLSLRELVMDLHYNVSTVFDSRQLTPRELIGIPGCIFSGLKPLI